MNTLVEVLTALECLFILAALVLAVCILWTLHRIDAIPPADTAQKDDAPTDSQRRVEQGFDNLMSYDTDVAKASRKNRGGEV